MLSFCGDHVSFLCIVSIFSICAAKASTICGLLCVASSIYDNVFKIYPHCSMCQYFFLLLSSIPLCGKNKHILFICSPVDVHLDCIGKKKDKGHNMHYQLSSVINKYQ